MIEMNWCGDLIQAETGPNDTVLDLGCGIMQNTLDHIPTYPKTRLKCGEITGVDIYAPYLKWLNENYPEIKTLQHDLTDLPLPFKSKSQDVVLLCDILEHLKTKEEALNLIEESERIARKRVLILTPRIFFDNIQTLNSYNLGYNPHQRHKQLIKRELLEEMKYKTQIPPVDPNCIFAVKRLNLRIIHIWDNAGVAGLMSKYQRKLGHESKVFVLKRDLYGFDDFYDETNMKNHEERKKNKSREGLKNNPLTYLYRNLKVYYVFWKHIRAFKPDIIHFHHLAYLPLLFPFRKKLIEFHGTILRREYADGSLNELRKVKNWFFPLYRMLNVHCFYSTPDLAKDIPKDNNARHIPNPIDVEHFRAYTKEIKGLALYSKNHYEQYDKDRMQRLSEKHGLVIKILDRENNDYVKYEKFPAFLSPFEYYVDRYNIPSLSKTALEFLAMGKKVVNWRNEVIEGLPTEHYPENVAKRTIEIYRKMLEGN